MNNIIKLVTKDSVSIGNREFTRVMGGFNENSVIVTGKQVGELLEYANGDKSVKIKS